MDIVDVMASKWQSEQRRIKNPSMDLPYAKTTPNHFHPVAFFAPDSGRKPQRTVECAESGHGGKATIS
jgi:hypothetical protein